MTDITLHASCGTELVANHCMDLLETGTYYSPEKTSFCVWAPIPSNVEIVLCNMNETHPMKRHGDYWKAEVHGLAPDSLYVYRLNSSDEKPDPCSMAQPLGVHGPSQVVDLSFCWTDNQWKGIALDEYVLYELHVGTFTPEGTFDAIIPHVGQLRRLGITAIELMPVSQFPGERNWGYDGVYPYAVHWGYGGPQGLKRLVAAAHNVGIAVVLDVVYNHMGPEGNYFGLFGHYYTDCYSTPWGRALNFDQAYCDPVRAFFIENAKFWIKEFHIDGLRLDACHLIIDMSPVHILAEMHSEVENLAKALGRQVHLFAETDANDTRCILPRSAGGDGIEAQWLDDFHHSLYTLLDGANAVHYLPDYNSVEHLAKAYEDGYVYTGQYCPSRKRKHGISSAGLSGDHFVVFIQNHDQVGNQLDGVRLIKEVSFETLKMAAAAVIFSPYIPMLFMGEEYGETAPFQYFTDHSDTALIEAVRNGRKEEFAQFGMGDSMPDPQAHLTFTECILNHDLAAGEQGKLIWKFHQHLLETRSKIPVLKNLDKRRMTVHRVANADVLILERHGADPYADKACLVIINLSGTQDVVTPVPVHIEGAWVLRGDTADITWNGPGSLAPRDLTITANSLPVEISVRPQSVAWYESV